jgi:hypothetical protein
MSFEPVKAQESGGIAMPKRIILDLELLNLQTQFTSNYVLTKPPLQLIIFGNKDPDTKKLRQIKD